MRTKWRIFYYKTDQGICEVLEFLKSRKASDLAKAMAWIGMLEDKGPQLPRPYADLLRDGVHELRMKLSGDQVRVLYFFAFRDIVVLTHSFIKNANQVPDKEIKKAIGIRADFLLRFPNGEVIN